jgi:hypothetical protein
MRKIRFGVVTLVAILSFFAAAVRYANGLDYFWPVLTGLWVVNYLVLLREKNRAIDAMDRTIEKYSK